MRCDATRSRPLTQVASLHAAAAKALQEHEAKVKGLEGELAAAKAAHAAAVEALEGELRTARQDQLPLRPASRKVRRDNFYRTVPNSVV